MATKEEIINSIPLNKVTISRKEFVRLVSSITVGGEENLITLIEKPKYIKKGDVYVVSVGGKKRPVVVAKVLEDTVIGIPLSTTEDELNLCKSSSRFLGKGWFSKQLLSSKKTFALENWVGIYDNPKLLNKAISKLRIFYNNIL